MDQRTAKRLFVSALMHVDRETDDEADDYRTAPDDEDIDPHEALDTISEALWGCFDVVDAPESALEAIGSEPGVTYHDAVLWRAVNWFAEQGDDRTVVHNLRDIFVKDQRGRHGDTADVSRERFRQWLEGYLGPEADDLMRLWVG